jgi:hypothetical protein
MWLPFFSAPQAGAVRTRAFGLPISLHQPLGKHDISDKLGVQAR